MPKEGFRLVGMVDQLVDVLRIRGVLLTVGVGLAVLSPSASLSQALPALEELSNIFPNAERLTPYEGRPPAATVIEDGKVAGYILSTDAVVGSVGYSGKPLDVIVGLGLDGKITGAYLRHHSEPILVIGVPEEHLKTYVSAFAGTELDAALIETEAEPGRTLPDAISGATVSSAVIADSILRSARAVARSRGIIGDASRARVDRESFVQAGWASLISDGSIAHRRISLGEIDGTTSNSPGDLFIELYATLVTPPTIGQNLLGKRTYNKLVSGMAADENVILIAANGLYSFKGTAYVRSDIFDRIQIVQGTRTIRFSKSSYKNVESLRTGAPELREIGLFIIPMETGFDPLEPWRLDLFVSRAKSDAMVLSSFSLDYAIPKKYRIGSETDLSENSDEESPILAAIGNKTGLLWLTIWQQRGGAIAAVITLLIALTGILLFQDSIARHLRVYRAVRLGFLIATLVGLGWLTSAQLSVVNVLTFVHSLLSEFKWEFFLLDPLLFILWSYVAVALLFWGRGVFCGWLCPFGALQELASTIARRVRVPQFRVPFGLHERLWPIKYIVFLGLFAISLHSTNLAVIGAEVEPFKTAIVLGFERAWPFVAYTLGLIGIGLFVERFFCRYICPLGGALAIPARGRMFEWLKRRFQCGRDCHICETNCPVQAIHPTGEINPNECIHCLKCQTLYYDEETCPPLIARRKRRERLAASNVDLEAARSES